MEIDHPHPTPQVVAAMGSHNQNSRTPTCKDRYDSFLLGMNAGLIPFLVELQEFQFNSDII